jgi:acetyl-CoA carboxylase carboxyltransferase component
MNFLNDDCTRPRRSPPAPSLIRLQLPLSPTRFFAVEHALDVAGRTIRSAARIATPEERAELHARLTAELKRSNTAVESTAKFLYDDVIDPADTRDILIRTLETLPAPVPRTTRKRVIEPF